MSEPTIGPQRIVRARTLPDACVGCAMSSLYCSCVRDLDRTPCCGSCDHEGDQ